MRLYVFLAFKMNTNGIDDNAPTFGQYCYDYADTRRSEVSSDYLALLGAYTFQGNQAAETAHFCGIFDGTNTIFPDIFSKSIPILIQIQGVLVLIFFVTSLK